ncbi:MAG: SPL family radical SAM protein [Myxococcota bacterium]
MEEESNIKIVIDSQSPRNNFVKEIIRRAHLNKIEIVENLDTQPNQREKLLYISSQRGFIRPCPCSKRYRCCNYFTIDTIEGCIYDCEYCILKSFLNNSKILIKADIGELISELKEFTSRISGGGLTIRIGTGELSDSLALENIAPFAPILIEETKENNNLILEFKTKSSNVSEILNLPHNPLATISFSMTTPYLHQKLETGTPSIENRVVSAKRCVEHSYRVGFHFDPIIYYQEFEKDYDAIIKMISQNIPPEAISWVSLGTIRFNPLMFDIFNNPILFGEYITDLEKKSRYPFVLRKKIYRSITSMFNHYFNSKVKLYLCMELDIMNKIILGRTFDSDEELNRYIIGKNE